MMGLEKLLRGLYGSVPQLDMDRQFARVRVVTPQTFDFKALADGIKRNNVGTAGIELEATTELRDGQVVVQPTGQRFRLSGPLPEKNETVRRRLKVIHWEDPTRTEVQILR
ncbi:MAG: hypothetical protein EHM91_08475 [Planctomycetota bacterium]|nr:MAG: hypothetical protein EHM91_08475 [Planctomycetota bacterium]